MGNGSRGRSADRHEPARRVSDHQHRARYRAGRARGRARTRQTHRAAVVPGESHDITLETGGWIRGRILKDGRPVPGLALGLVQANRSSQKFIGHTEIGTNNEGEFEFPNIPQNNDYYLYSLMSGSEKLGALAVYELHLGSNRKVLDVGELPMEPAFRLAGRVLLSNGRPIHEGTRLMLSRQRAWDDQSAKLDSDGRFSFEAIPEEAIELIIRIDGYRVSPARNRFQLTRDGCLALFMDKGRPAVEIHLEQVPVKAK